MRQALVSIRRAPGNFQAPLMQSKLRQDLWRTGHVHAGVLLVLSLVALRYVDEAELSSWLQRFSRLLRSDR